MMKLNEKILSIPPYISTSWQNVSSMKMEGRDLVITLKDGTAVAIPHPEEELVNRLFELHQLVLERAQGQSMPQAKGTSQEGKGAGAEFPFPFRLGMTGTDGISAALSHNPEQRDGPDLPPDMLHKISQVAKLVLPNDPQALPKAEPHCNCMFCQIARAIATGMGLETPSEIEDAASHEEEEVSQEDLTFSEWTIEQVDEKLFSVVKKLDPTERYRVFLGEPVGCTCGKAHCEHILAVLRS